MKQFKRFWNLKTKKQVRGLLDKTIRIRESRFIKDFSWTSISLYNEVIQSKNEIKELFLTGWMAAVGQFLKGQSIGRIEPSKVKFTIERIGGKFESIIEAKLSDLLWLWLWHVIKGDLIVKICEAGDCPRIFTPTGRKDQTFCSYRCRMRIVMRRIKKRKELRLKREANH